MVTALGIRDDKSFGVLGAKDRQSRFQSLTNLLLHSRQSVGSATGHLTPELLVASPWPNPDKIMDNR